MEIQFIIVRHAESQANIELLVAGHTDDSLTEVGQQQAAAAGEYLKDTPIVGIYASDLSRTMETAREIAKANTHLKSEVKPVELLRERFFGECENLPFHEMVKMEGYTGPDYVPKGAESWSDVATRAKAFFKEFLVDVGKATDRLDSKASPSPTYVLVTHGGVISMFVKHLVDDLGCELPDGKSVENATNIALHNTSMGTFSVKVSPAGESSDLRCVSCFATEHLKGKENLKDGVAYDKKRMIKLMRESGYARK